MLILGSRESWDVGTASGLGCARADDRPKDEAGAKPDEQILRSGKNWLRSRGVQSARQGSQPAGSKRQGKLPRSGSFTRAEGVRGDTEEAANGSESKLLGWIKSAGGRQDERAMATGAEGERAVVLVTDDKRRPGERSRTGAGALRPGRALCLPG